MARQADDASCSCEPGLPPPLVRWARETLLGRRCAGGRPGGGRGGGDRADPAEDHASLVAKLAEWHDRGQRVRAMSEAHTAR